MPVCREIRSVRRSTARWTRASLQAVAEIEKLRSIASPPLPKSILAGAGIREGAAATLAAWKVTRTRAARNIVISETVPILMETQILQQLHSQSTYPFRAAYLNLDKRLPHRSIDRASVSLRPARLRKPLQQREVS